MPDLAVFSTYDRLVDQLVENSTKEQIAEAARLLALNLAHYQLKYGALPLDGFLEMMKAEVPDENMAEILIEGMQNLVGVLGLVVQGHGDKTDDLH